jgi:hypothetical protein
MSAPTEEQLLQLKKASETFLSDKDYGQAQVDPILESIFGDYSTRLANPIACEWAAYWQALALYEEEYKEHLNGLGKGKTVPVKPAVRKQS